MMSKGLCLSLIMTFGVIPLVSASEKTEGFLNRSEVRQYIHELSDEHGLNVHTVSGLFANTSSQQSVLDKISSPAERTLTWREYRPIFITQERINAGLEFFDAHKPLLLQAQTRYGVPAEVITAIIGVETFYGRITGSYNVLEALATLAFDYPPRSSFFSSELSEFIVLGSKEGWDMRNIKGSYAGAMGFPQFISSSYRAYAIDFDNDGKRDLFNSTADIIGSVANYLARHGWVADAPIAERWQADAASSDAARSLVSDSLKPAVNADALRVLGFDSNLLDVGTQSDEPLSVMLLNGSQGEELWIGYRNFYAITRYNHSRLYAMAVFQLADAIRTAS